MDSNSFEEFYSGPAPVDAGPSPLDAEWTSGAGAPVPAQHAYVAAPAEPQYAAAPASQYVAAPAEPQYAAAPASQYVAAPAPAPQYAAAPLAPAPPAPAPLAPAPLVPAPLVPAPAMPIAPPVSVTPTPLAAPAAPPAPAAPAPTSSPAAVAAEVDKPVARAAMEEDSGVESLHLTDLLIEVLRCGASDLHLTAGARPTIRHHGHLVQMEDRPELTPPVIQRMIYAILTQKQREKFEENLELDFAYAVPGKARFRVNVYKQRDAIGSAFRLIPFEIKPLEALGVPPQLANFAMLPRGFVLVTGPTGSGKSTTLASIVDLANRQRQDHIMTVEDPIEFLHQHKSCIVNQREVGEDTHSFGNALKHVLRQDPDIILVGEMRDLETISVALTAAETGHLVFATLHTQDAAQTIDRVIDVFPPHQQQQVRVQLAGAIQGVVCQTLARTADGKGRVVACEVMVVTPAIRNLIREGKTHQIYSALQAGAKYGMQTMDAHLAELVKTNKITYETGLEKSHHAEDFNRLCGRG
ncbi:MAG: twitching motility protein PilT [Frankiaceae bacterium]|nr:twitching motility protein PilT [Frankiaceae bacterium]